MTTDNDTKITLYVGQTQQLFALAPSGLRAFANLWESEIKKHTEGAVLEAIEKLESERDEERAPLEPRITQAVQDGDFDLVTELAIMRANINTRFEQKIEIARLIPSSASFEIACEKYAITARKPAGNGTQNLEVDKVYRITRYGHTRYWLVTDGKVSCHETNGDNSSLVVELTAETWADLYPYAMASLTKLGMVHDAAYHREGAGGSTVQRLKKAETNLPAWWKGVGLDSVTSNGVNSITTLELSPSDWLEKNPPVVTEKKEVKAATKK